MAEDNIEIKLKKLEAIVAELENGNADIDKMVKLFTDGMKLAKECRTQLNAIEFSIKELEDK